MTIISDLKAIINKKKTYKYYFIGVIVLFILASIKIAKGFDQGTDFNVFYQSGVNFSNNVSLYSRIGGAERYIYPPFAAMVFQLFHIFSMKVAGGVWIFINWLMYVGTIWIMVQLLKHFKVEAKTIKFALIAGVILSIRFVWYHAMFAQMNLLVLFLSLLGILLFLKGKQWPVAFCLAAAISIKVLPVIVLVWIVSKSDLKMAFKALAALVICTLLPILFRGYNLWSNDLVEYYVTFIEPFKEGRVEPNFQNYSLSAAVYKILMPTSGDNNPLDYAYNLFNTSGETAQRAYKLISLGFVLMFAIVLIYSRFIAKRISMYEVSFILLFTHLFSGITWEYHLVSLLFVETLFFLQVKKSDSVSIKVAHYLFIAFMALNAIIGLDTVGAKLYYLSCGYSFLTLLMLLFLIHSLYKIFTKDDPAIPVGVITSSAVNS